YQTSYTPGYRSMKIASFEFNLRELSGSFGNLGTFLPLAVGYFAVCGLNPAGLLVMMGLANIATGIFYRLPIPIEPMKVIAAAAIAQQWSPSMVYAAGFSMGCIWLIFALSDIASRLSALTPAAVVRGVQVTLGILLVIQACKMLATSWLLGGIALLVGLGLRTNRRLPAAVALVLLGVLIMATKNQLGVIQSPSFTLPPLTTFSLKEIWQSLLLAGFAQIPLTVTNATIATSCLISAYWPNRTVSPRRLSLSQGLMNLVPPFFGGMPMCHGAGGLAGQYYFGARTGGTNIIEGIVALILGLFFATSVAGLFSSFPKPVTGVMLLLVGVELIKFARDVRDRSNILSLVMTVVLSLATNMAFGFVGGILTNLLLSNRWRRNKA
ncbi:MAG: putative sulfate/molybdate transporter, partial [Geobacteraceae bacterium]|nr:putative sulfate/molybdate transporter [Geobacteraceae bacterium]